MAKPARTTQTSKPGGRPKKTGAEGLSERLTFRMSIAERGRLEAEAAQAGMSPSDYVRARLFSTRRSMPSPAPQAVDPALISLLNKVNLELRRVGNNANQLALATHRDSSFTQFWREIGDEVRFAAVQARSALNQVLDE